MSPSNSLKNILTEIQRQLPPSLMLPHSIPNNLHKYHKMLQAILIPDTRKFHVLTSVPLAHTKDQYDVHKVINLPVLINKIKAI